MPIWWSVSPGSKLTPTGVAFSRRLLVVAFRARSSKVAAGVVVASADVVYVGGLYEAAGTVDLTHPAGVSEHQAPQFRPVVGEIRFAIR